MDTAPLIAEFLAGSLYAVVGASRDRRKYGNKVLRAYLQQGRRVVPVNPNADVIEGLKAYSALGALPEVPFGISVITPPDVTQKVISQAADLGVDYVWLQPGAENERVIQRAEQLGLKLIHSGPCLLVVLGFRESQAD